MLWHHADELRKRGHHVELINVRPRQAVQEMWRVHRSSGPFDWVIVHHERLVRPMAGYAHRTGARLAALSHMPLTGYQTLDPFTRGRMRMVAKAPYHFCLTPDVLLATRTLNRDSRAAILPNGVDPLLFRFSPERGNGRALCLGLVGARKRQAAVAEAAPGPVDFVGPLDSRDPSSRAFAQRPEYLGIWTRSEVRDRLTDYSALVLWSASEGQPLVLSEAFAAGLSVVVSPAAARNLDVSRPWVHVARTAEQLPAMLTRAIAENATYRTAIRAYAEADWSWRSVAERMEERLLAWQEGTA